MDRNPSDCRKRMYEQQGRERIKIRDAPASVMKRGRERAHARNISEMAASIQ